MRTSVNIDADAYAVVSAYAGARGITLGAALSEMVRRAEASPAVPASASPRLAKNEHGYLEIVGTPGVAVTSAMVKEASEDDLA